MSPQENADLRLLSRLGADCLHKEPTERPDAMTLLRQLQEHMHRPIEMYPNDEAPRRSICQEQVSVACGKGQLTHMTGCRSLS